MPDVKSIQLARLDSKIPVLSLPSDLSGKLRFEYFEFTTAEALAAGSTVDLVKVNPGGVRILHSLSKISVSALGASRVLDFGHRAYETPDDTTVAEDGDAFDADVDVSSAVNVATGSDLAEPKTWAMNSRKGVTLFVTVTGGTIPANATIKGYIVYVSD